MGLTNVSITSKSSKELSVHYTGWVTKAYFTSDKGSHEAYLYGQPSDAEIITIMEGDYQSSEDIVRDFDIWAEWEET